VRRVLPTLPMAAALSTNHLAALLLPPTLRRLYIARDNDAAGEVAATTLTERAEATGVETIVWMPRRSDCTGEGTGAASLASRSALRSSSSSRRCCEPAPREPWNRALLVVDLTAGVQVGREGCISRWFCGARGGRGHGDRGLGRRHMGSRGVRL
jgi:hypothetical protein